MRCNNHVQTSSEIICFGAHHGIWLEQRCKVRACDSMINHGGAKERFPYLKRMTAWAPTSSQDVNLGHPWGIGTMHKWHCARRKG